MYSGFQLVIVGLIFFVCLYALVDRICKCVEQRAIAKSFAQFQKNNPTVNIRPEAIKEWMERVQKINEQSREKKAAEEGSKTD